MGLFDRFRKKVKQTDDDYSFLADEDSELAEKAIAEREAALRSMNQREKAPEEKAEPDSEWDDFEDEIVDPFATPKNSKERKRAARDQASKPSHQPSKTSKSNPMDSTTGRRLAESDMTFEIDLSEYHTNIGGMVISGGPVLDEILDELEDELLSSDMGHDAASELITNLRAHLIGSRVSRKTPLSEVVERSLRGALLALLKAGYWDFDRTIRDFVSAESPVVIMMVGVNGTGKTTTSAKIAKRLDNQGFGVVLAAADTFRAGAIDQLAAHAERLGIRCIKSQRGGDAAAVARDAIESAKAKGDEVVIIDTSGRMQNKSNLMEELQKVHRVTKPHLVIFVADALAGNDAVTQAVEFQRRLTFDGAALCKLDTDARGGAALSISHATGRPIILAGTGQGYDDLEPFDPNWLVDQLLS
ncbi:MAG: signal recognition particle-docking protein FtsY [Euryarchaeota archaeon]|jgi:fused signal recognition particle receptor|nr:signal recognition particle-docking protein FtsY [Euryarchaeota archaeon]|tara:strand:+ start:1640 stop:2887 length:1248 start_codon:yes stop_codon:yes gene_type:complete